MADNVIAEQVWERPQIMRMSIPLPENPLRSLNSYVIRDNDDFLVIDTGFRRPECRNAFFKGLEEIGADPSKCTLFLTHLHGDHTGLAAEAEDRGMNIIMGRRDHERLSVNVAGDGWKIQENMFRENGFPEDVMVLQRNNNHAMLYSTDRMFRARLVEDKDRFTVGSMEFVCIMTPGHTPGHMCLYMPAEKLLFTGDHILYTITPNISIFPGVEDSLGDYLQSLNRIAEIDVVCAFAGHRQQGDFKVRIGELKEHHRKRLDEAYGVICNKPGLSAYEIAQYMTWSMRNLQWKDFPPGQKWFATGEAAAHIRHLIRLGKVKEEICNGVRIFRQADVPVSG